LILSLALIAVSGPIRAEISGYAYVTNSGSNNVSGYSIDDATGALTPLPGSPFAAGVLPQSIAAHPSGRFVYVTNVGIGGINEPFHFSISEYRVDPATGALTAVPGSPLAISSSPIYVTVHPNGRFVYVSLGQLVNGASTGGIAAYRVNASTGALTEISGSPFTLGNLSENLAVTPNGRFLYMANNIPGQVFGLAIDAISGGLTPVPGSPFAAGQQTFGVTIHPNGKFTYAVNVLSDDMSIYSINASTGALTPIQGSPFFVGLAPLSMTFSPDGRFAYVPNTEAPNISGFAVDGSTGALTSLPGSPFPTSSPGPLYVAVSPDGKFAYVQDQFFGGVWAYSVDHVTGALSELPDSPFPSGSHPIQIITIPVDRSCQRQHRHGDEQDDHERDSKHDCDHSHGKHDHNHDHDQDHDDDHGGGHD
jgi:6-phosphogluconolactonase (cycloisomerase 2 family)